jgi:hypothetical protein
VDTVLFAWVQNAGRSQIAAAFFQRPRRSAEGARDFSRHLAGRAFIQ